MSHRPTISVEDETPADVRLAAAVAGLRKTLDRSLTELRSVRRNFDRRMDRLEGSVRDSLALLHLAGGAQSEESGGPGNGKMS